MTKSTRISWLRSLSAAAALVLPQIAAAGDFDGKTNLLCAVMDASGCDAAGNCTSGRARAFDLPDFFDINFQTKELRPRSDEADQTVSPIREVFEESGKLVLQGAENGHAWSIVINQKNGDFTGAIAEDRRNYSLFGACTGS